MSDLKFDFNPGDLVLKARGALHNGKIGIVLSVQTNSLERILITVLSENKIRKWYGRMVNIL